MSPFQMSLNCVSIFNKFYKKKWMQKYTIIIRMMTIKSLLMCAHTHHTQSRIAYRGSLTKMQWNYAHKEYPHAGTHTHIILFLSTNFINCAIILEFIICLIQHQNNKTKPCTCLKKKRTILIAHIIFSSKPIIKI